MFLIQGPHPLIQSSIVLPSPQLGNTNQLASTIQVIRMSDGSKFTYVKKRRGRRRLRFDFRTSKDKSIELTKFVDAYGGMPVKVTDHNGVVLIGYITLNPFEVRASARARDLPGGELYVASIELEEKL